MRHLNLQLEKLEQRIAPWGGGGSHKSHGSGNSDKSHGSKSHGSKSNGSKG